MDDRASMLHEGEGVYPGGVHPGGIHPVDVKPEEPPLSAGEVGRLEDENLTANNDSPSLGAQEKEGIDTRNQEVSHAEEGWLVIAAPWLGEPPRRYMTLPLGEGT